MSWSVYAAFTSVEKAKEHVAALSEPTPEKPWGTPPEAKALIIAAIECSGFEAPTAIKIEAAGHKPRGTTKVIVEPFALYT